MAEWCNSWRRRSSSGRSLSSKIRSELLAFRSALVEIRTRHARVEVDSGFQHLSFSGGPGNVPLRTRPGLSSVPGHRHPPKSKVSLRESPVKRCKEVCTNLLAALLLTTLATLTLEILDTRLLSVLTWYHLSFFAVSIAMFGMAAGAVHVYLGGSRFEGAAAQI